MSLDPSKSREGGGSVPTENGYKRLLMTQTPTCETSSPTPGVPDLSRTDIKTEECNRTLPFQQRSSVQNRWLALLAERPAGLEGLDAWISRILYTEFDLSTENTNFTVTTNDDDTSSCSQEQEWSALLRERPVPSDSCASVTRWLRRALSVSCRGYSSNMPETPKSSFSNERVG